MEEIKYGGISLEVPSGLGDDFSFLLDIISPDTWNNIFTDEHREMLMRFLPDFPEDDLSEKTQTLEMFFMNENFNFGSPLQKFFLNFKQGFYNPDVAKVRKIHRKILYKSYKYRQKKYVHNLLEEILVTRKQILNGNKDETFEKEQFNSQQQNSPVVLSKKEMCIQRARKRYFKELKAVKAEAGCDSDISDDDSYPDGLGLSLNKKQRRQLFLLEASFPPNLCPVRSTHTKGSLALDLEATLTLARNPFDTSDEHLRSQLACHLANLKKKNCPSLDTRGITLKSILERTEFLSRKPVQRPQPTAVITTTVPAVTRSPLPATPTKKVIARKKPKLSFGECVPSAPLIPCESIKKELSSDSSSDSDGLQDIDVSVSGAKDYFCSSPASISTASEDIKPPLKSELTQETHLSFFSLLRDVICSTSNQRMSRQQLASSISTWQDSAISPLNEWFCLSDSWVNVLPSAINFLCGNLPPDLLPSDFVPFIEYKVTLKYFQWIGAGRDSDANLEPLSQYWLPNRDNICCDWPKDTIFSSDLEDTKLTIPLQGKVQKNWPMKASPPGEEVSEKTEYHEQERIRYDQPHKAFTYRMNGYESVIGPVKGVYSQHTGSMTKARGHMLLVPDRPPYVTILSLVWDAVARLPNSEGTKTDICELVKKSQFLVAINTQGLENTLNGVVSGALDRLQNEKDPCVKFDTSRKLWVYLHRSMSEKELEVMHQMKLRNGSCKSKSQSTSRKSIKKKDDASFNQGPPNVTVEQYAPAIKQMDGSEVRIKDEDILKNWVKLATTTKAKKKEKSNPDASSLARGSQSVSGFSSTNLAQTSDDAKVNLSSEGVPQRVCSSMQFSKGSSPLMQTASSSSALSPSSAKSPLRPQTSRKYQSSSEKKKLIKSAELGVASASSKAPLFPASTTKVYHTQPTTTTTTTAVLTQSKGLKLLQYSNPNLQAKGVIGGASLVVDTSTSVPTLVGQKLVVAGNRVLVQGGKVLHNVSAANVGGRAKQVLAGILPGQHIVAVNSAKKAAEHQVAEGGRFIQIATVDAQNAYQKQTGYQKLTLVPQFNQAALTANAQKEQDTQALGTLPKCTITAGELKLKLGSAAFATTAGNIINLGGKQILLTTKGNPTNRGAQIHQVVVGDSRARLDVAGGALDTLRGATSTQQIVVPHTAGAQQATVVATSTSTPHVVASASGALTQQRLGIAGGQQIVVPASALVGSQLNLKRLQAFQSFKVVPASQLSQQQHHQQRGKPVVAHILATSSAGGAAGSGTTAKLALQLATAQSDASHEKK